MSTTERRLGRPPDTSSEETRARIIDAARRCFARHGYEATTNKQLATEAELTTGAIYHYFGSKRDLFFAAHEQVETFVYERFKKVTAPETTFETKIHAVLDEVIRLNSEDPTLAEFLVAARTDSGRSPDLDDERLKPYPRYAFFGSIIDCGIENGEISADDRQTVLDVIGAVMMGLVSASSSDPDLHARTVDGVKRLVSNTLIRSH